MHVTSGVSALVCALYLGKRLGYPRESVPPHSVVLSFVGACLLWVGSFGFNAGSALPSGSLATSAFVATHFAVCLRLALELEALRNGKRNGKPSALRSDLRRGGGLSGDYPSIGICEADARDRHRIHRGNLMLSDGCGSKGAIWLR